MASTFPDLFTFVSTLAVAVALGLGFAVPAAAQADGAEPAPQHDMAHMHMIGGSMMPPPREGSGTSWLPDDTPMYAVHAQAGAWTLMVHGNAFVQYVEDTGARGAAQAGSINWFMGSADRALGGGRFGLRAMASLEPWTIRGCGYPDLLATGERCGGSPIHDRQHPHDLMMELAAIYDRPLARGLRWQVYGGPAGEPALGPTAFPHRISAMPGPLAPITHHWLDSTHITFGVVTGGVYGAKWKAEASAFNGREPDENRTNLDLGPLDSWSARLSFLPTRQWALQLSGGRLTAAEAAANPLGPRVDIDRVTASATYHRLLGERGIWATTIAWGRNSEPHEAAVSATNALLAETNVSPNDRDTWFGRIELSQKSGQDLVVAADGPFTVARLQAGYARYARVRRRLQAGVGGSLSAGIVPESLASEYGRRVNLGFVVFVTARPGRAAE